MSSAPRCAFDLAMLLDMPYVVVGNPQRRIERPAALDRCPSGGLAFAATNPELQHAIDRGLRNAIIVCLADPPAGDNTLIVVDTPKLAFATIVNAAFPASPRGVHPAAVIHDCVRLGAHVEVGAGAVLGAPGFGYVRRPDGVLIPFPQLAGVVVEDNVSIGNCTCIDRGALADTIIRRGVKIDNLVHVAHGVEIGEHTLVVATAEISGSVKIGRCCQIGPGVCIREHVTIGDHVQVGMGAVVVKDVPSHSVVVGSPAEPLVEFEARRQRLREVLQCD